MVCMSVIIHYTLQVILVQLVHKPTLWRYSNLYLLNFLFCQKLIKFSPLPASRRANHSAMTTWCLGKNVLEISLKLFATRLVETFLSNFLELICMPSLSHSLHVWKVFFFTPCVSKVNYYFLHSHLTLDSWWNSILLL